MSETEQDCGEHHRFSEAPRENFHSCNKRSHISFGASVLLLSKLLVNNAVCTGNTSFFKLTYAQDVVEVVALAGVGTVLKGAICEIWPDV